MCQPEPIPVPNGSREPDRDQSLAGIDTDHKLTASDDTLRLSSETQGSPQQSESKVQADARSNGRVGKRLRLSLREYFGLVTIAILMMGLVFTLQRQRRIEAEVTKLRAETGYLHETGPGQIAAVRAPSDQPLTYRVRVRVPTGSARFRVAYSSLWPRHSTTPDWFGAVPVPSGESLVTLRILEDPRDRRWKIATLVASVEGNQRMATVLPPDHVKIFRGSHNVVSTGVSRETHRATVTDAIRLLDERWLVGEGALLLYGDRAPEDAQIGIYAELQPDVGPL